MRLQTKRYVADDGVNIVADVAGALGAPRVVLMHGGGQTRHSWQGLMGALVSKGYRVVNFDARGHGESDWAGVGGYGLARHAHDLACVLEEEGAPAALVGASLGGATALRAMAEGARPAAVILVDIVPRPDPRGVQRIRDFMLGYPDGFASIDDALEAVAAYNPHRPRPVDREGLMRNLRYREDGRLRWHWDPAFLSREIPVELVELHETVEGARRAGDVPCMLIRGLKSDVVGDAGLAELRGVLPAIEVFDVPGAGHMVAGDRNDVFIEGVTAFLSRHFPVG